MADISLVGTRRLVEGKAGDKSMMQIILALSAPVSQDVKVKYATADNTKLKNSATAGLDYTAASGELIILAGQTFGTIEVEILGDALSEGDEIFDLSLSEPVGAGFSKGTTLSTTGTIVDDEKALSVSSAKLVEGKAGDKPKMQFMVSLTEAAGQDVKVKFATADNTKSKNAAVAGEDYTATTGELTILAGKTSGIIEVEVLGDGIRESNEIFDLILTEPVGAGFSKGSSLVATGTIFDDEKTINVSSSRVVEGKTGDTPKMQFVVSLSGVSAQDVTVKYATADNIKLKNAAKAGEDYTATSGTLTIPTGQTSATIEVGVLGDGLLEGFELFDMVLSDPVGAGIAKGTTLVGTGTIVDDEKTISVSNASADEGKTGDKPTMQFVVSLSGASAQDVKINFETADNVKAKNAAKAGEDYTAATGILTIPAGARSGIIDITLLGDALKEGNEVFDLVLSGATGAGFSKGSSLTSTGTINDDEQSLTISTISTGAVGSSVEGKAGTKSKIQFLVSLPDAAGQDVTVNYTTADNTKVKNAAKAGEDYTATTGTLKILAGQTSGVIEVEVLGDALYEGNEIFDLVLSDVTGAGFAKGSTLATSATIIDDEQTVTLLNGKVLEGKALDKPKMQFVASLSDISDQDVTVKYATADNTKLKNAAKAGEDYTATSGTLTIPAGQTMGIIEVETLGDGVWEGNEIFDLVLSEILGAGFGKGTGVTGTGTIVDDEKILSLSAASIIEGGTSDKPKMQFAVSLSGPAAQDVVVNYATADSTKAKNAALAGQDYTAKSGALTILAGKTFGLIDIEILGDTQKETSEVFDLILTDIVGAGFSKGTSIQVVGTIIDDEPSIFFL